jgi:FtsP/CotA-like multicopper oxidase with cupredoxin domain
MVASLRRPRSLALLLVGSLVLAGTIQQLVSRAALGASVATCRRMDLYAEELPKSPQGAIRLGFGETPATATYPGPLIELTEGQCLKIRLTNHVSEATLQKLKDQFGGQTDLPLAVSIHPHGVKYRRDSDGTMSSESFVLPGQTRTFTWSAAPLTAGYWWYHDHMVGTESGSGGMASGLTGGLVIRRAGDSRPDVPTFVVAMGDNFTLDYQTYPDTPNFTATEGQRVEFLVYAWGNETHAFHLHGHSWADNRTGLFQASSDTPAIDNKTIAPASSFGFQVIAGQDVGTNDWMYHCHVQFHSDNGMMGFLTVNPAG